MYIQCLGSGDAFGTGGRLNSSFFIRTRDHGILLDCGVSAPVALKKVNLSVDEIDLVIVSHLHGDHYGGIPFIICEKQVTGKGNRPLTVIGPEGTEDNVRQVLQCFFPGVKMTDASPVRFLTYTRQQNIYLDSIHIAAYAAVHVPATNPHSLRITAEGKVVAYSGDTEWNENLIRVSQDADLFICEGYAYSSPVRHHMWISRLLEHLNTISAKKIVLTHLGEEALKNAATIPLAIASDGEVLMRV